MHSIDTYIQRTNNKDGGIRRTKAYTFNEDGVILVQKSEMHFDELKKKIQFCKEQGINIPMYIDYKFDGENYWILEELAPGKEFQYLVDNDNITKLFADMPYEHIKKYIRDVYLLQQNGIGVEPRRRNIFYDKDKGFTTIDVGLLSQVEDPDSLKKVNYFFDMYGMVCLPPLSDNEYGDKVREKTILNIMRSFETVHPFFEKYKRWVYRGNSYFAHFLEEHGTDLTLDEKEKVQLEDFIGEVIDDTVQYRIEHPEEPVSINSSYISLLSSSIDYCPNFDLFDLKTQNLNEYVEKFVNNKIKDIFYSDMTNTNLRNLYFEIRRRELDPVRKYPIEYIYGQIENEITVLHSKKQ